MIGSELKSDSRASDTRMTKTIRDRVFFFFLSLLILLPKIYAKTTGMANGLDFGNSNVHRRLASNPDAVRIRSHYAEGPIQLQKNALLRGSTIREWNENNTVDDDEGDLDADSTNEQQSGDGSVMTAIVHIGPHKTGTTSIQAYTAILHDELGKDNYEMPWALLAHDLQHVNAEPYINLNQFNLVSCLQDIKELWPEAKCNPALIDATSKIAASKKNILLTAEEFARTDIVHIDRLKSLLKPWKNVKIVAYYRRFCDWLFSYWHQFAKYQSVEYRHSFPEYISNVEAMEQLHDHTYTVGAVSHYRVYFNDVVVFNMHDMGEYRDVSEIFYCETIHVPDVTINPDQPKKTEPGVMTNTCAAIKDRDEHGRFIDFNHAHALVYEELAWHAIQSNLITTNDTFTIKEITTMAKHHQERTLNKTQYDFHGYMICPSTELLDWLLQTTLDDEYEFFPKFFESPDGEEVIKAKFEKDSNSKFCAVDSRRIVKEHESWRQFFSSIMK